jgi:amino acid transporter
MSPKIDLKRIWKVLIRILIFVFFVTGVIFSGSFFTDLMKGASLVFVLLGGVGMALMGFSAREIGTAFKHAGGAPDGKENLQNSAYFWEAAARNFLMLGVLGAFISFVTALGRSRGGIANIALQMSESFLPAVYGMILGVICFVPVLKLTGKLSKYPLKEPKEAIEKPGENAFKILRFENMIGYALFIAVVGWTIVSSISLYESGGPLNPWEVFIYWPSLLVVLGGTIVLVMFIGDAAAGRSFTLSFALTGLIGSLMAFVQTLISFSARGVKDVASAMTFIISSCFLALLGMMLVGIPLEDRAIKTGKNKKQLTLSRIAWYVFPLVALILLLFAFVTVLIPIKKV